MCSFSTTPWKEVTGVFLLPLGWDATQQSIAGLPPTLHLPVPIHTPGWREALRVKSCPRTQHNIPGQGLNSDHSNIVEEEWTSKTNPLLFHPINMNLKLIFCIFAVVKMTSPLKNTFFSIHSQHMELCFLSYRFFFYFYSQVLINFFNYTLSSIAFSLSALFFLNSLLSGLFSGFRQDFNFCSKVFICSLFAVDFAWPLTKVAMFSIWLRTCC